MEAEVVGLTGNDNPSQGVYIYRPADSGKGHDERPSKRRKVQQHNSDRERTTCPFVPLLNGDESGISVQLRYQTYRQLWSHQETKIQEVLDDVDAEVLENVSSFIRSSSPQTYGGCIPAALITVGSNVSSLGRLLSRLNSQLTASGEGGVVVLESGDAPNLKTTLKNIIRAAIINTEGNDGYQKFLTDREGPRLLGYDLDLLGDYVTRRGVTNLVLAFRDSEAFDPGILTDLFALLISWIDRIPFTLLFGISTSVELFESRLPRSSVALLKGRFFEIHEASNCVDRIYEKLQADTDERFWLGRNVTGMLFEKSNDYFQTPETFGRTVKYAYMSHFFANPLSVLLAEELPAELDQKNLCQAIRNIPSFRKYCEDQVQDPKGSTTSISKLLEDDPSLFQWSLECIKSGQQAMRNIFQAVKLIHQLLKSLNIAKRTSISELSIRALSGELQDFSFIKDILSIFKTLDSTRVQENFLSILPQALIERPEFAEITSTLDSLLQSYDSAREKEPLRSEYDPHYSIMETTVVQHRVKINKGKAKLSEECVKYSRVIDRLHTVLESYFEETLLPPQDLPCCEVFLLDMRNPLKEVFAPRPRFAIERALSSPFDYLISPSQTGDQGQEGGKTRISAKQPATAILYQLYLESGALVNIHDLWQAFLAVYESERGRKEEGCDERMIMALFYQALSELKALGMLKTSRKKVDHAAKSAWIGL